MHQNRRRIASGWKNDVVTAREPKGPARALPLAQNSPWEMQAPHFPQGGCIRKGIAPEHRSPREAVQDSAHKSAETRRGFSSSPIQTQAELKCTAEAQGSFHKLPFLIFFRFHFTLLGEFSPISLCLSSCFQKKTVFPHSTCGLFLFEEGVPVAHSQRGAMTGHGPGVRQGCSFKSLSSKGNYITPKR